jgi:hypothetical protein
MGRGENEDVSGLDLPDPLKVDIVFYDDRGVEADEQKAVAKTVSTILGYEHPSTQRFILYGRGEILDPHGTDFRGNRNLYKYKKVSEDTFENYIKYLKSKNTLYFTRARRLVME